MPDKKLKDYELFVTVTRHGPKKSFSGPLTEDGKREIEGYFIYSYKANSITQQTQRRLVSSPVGRSLETAQIYEAVMEKHHHMRPVPLEQDPRLSEHNVEDFKNYLPPSDKEDWFSYWYRATKRPNPNISIGREAIKEFAQWLLEQITIQQDRGGSLRIEAFSHGPVMAGFILRLEEKQDIQILNPLKKGQSRLEFDKLFGNEESEFGFLGNISFCSSSDDPDNFYLMIRGKIITAPLKTLAEISQE